MYDRANHMKSIAQGVPSACPVGGSDSTRRQFFLSTRRFLSTDQHYFSISSRFLLPFNLMRPRNLLLWPIFGAPRRTSAPFVSRRS